MSHVDPVIDPRIADRRRKIREASARRRLKWVVVGILLLLIGGLVVAGFRSSWLSVAEIRIEGAEVADVEAILQEAGVEVGVPMISVRASKIESALLDDPWIARAEVRVTWPRSVDVIVLEYEPLAWIAGSPGALVASGGAVLAVGEPDGAHARIEADVGDVAAGSEIDDAAIKAALEFLGVLPNALLDDAVLEVGSAAITATISGHAVELGSPVDMPEKAMALIALLEEGIPQAATINLVSPLRPAVAGPQPIVEGSPEGDSEAEPSS